jgi:8-oxo-dGTP pyrophosphatase MutT (NUDIX family)
MKRCLATTQYMSLYENEDGIGFLKMGDGACIVPINSDGLVLVQTEPSFAFEGLRSLHIPGGSVDDGEDPALTANREMQEEIGYKANRLDYLGTVDLATKYITSRVYLYLGRDLQPSKLEGDEDVNWMQAHRPIDLSEVESLMASGILRDASTITALLLARQFLQRESS